MMAAWTSIVLAVIAAAGALTAAMKPGHWATNAGPKGPVPLDQLKQEPICIVGAGPGGLQTAFFFQQLGMPYVVLDKGTRGVGDFFRDYPIQRNLISINKVYTGTEDREFNMRHDWNSLLGHWDDHPGYLPGEADDARRINATASGSKTATGQLFAQYSKKYYPKADVLVKYLEDFASGKNLNVRLGRKVTAIHRYRNGTFRVTMVDTTSSSPDAKEKRQWCTSVVWATGQGGIRRLPKTTKGTEHLTYYDEMDPNPVKYTNKEVLVIGVGNAALEVVRSLEDYAAHVHLIHRGYMSQAHQTHYVGHARAVNLGILDRYQLKSLDLLLPQWGDASMMTYYKKNESDDRVYINVNADDSGTAGGGSLDDRVHREEEALFEEEASPLRRGYHHVIVCTGFFNQPDPFVAATQNFDKLVADECEAASNRKECGERVESEIAPVHPYYHERRRHPVVASNFESVNMRDLFVAGNLMHFRDFKRSSGGFIHGFRYLCRTLALLMRERYLAVPYPVFAVSTPAMPPTEKPFGGKTMKYEIPAAGERLIKYIVNRLSNASSLYQMQGQLADVIILDGDEDGAPVASSSNWVTSQPTNIHVLRDIPLDMATSKNPEATSPRRLQQAGVFLAVSLEFGPRFQGIGSLKHMGQEESPKRKYEKLGWHPEDDPDLYLGRANYKPLFSSRGDGETAVDELDPGPDMTLSRLPGEVDRPHKAAGFWSPRAQSPSTVAGDGDGYDENAPEYNGPEMSLYDDDGFKYNPRYNGRNRYREQFLHPVIRMYRRPPPSERKKMARSGPSAQKLPPLPDVSPDVSPAEMMHEFRLREEVLNEWSLPESHLRHLRAYVATHVFRTERDIE